MDENTRAITYPAETVTWLPRHLAKRNYATAAFHSHLNLPCGVSNVHEAFEEYHFTPEEKRASNSFRFGTCPIN